ncbi:hypothetical protein CBM2637_B20061 [Cupriavidus taiwanensis]|nr:hypothetical protein CBM2637_B20061 [Cupriavidus taiwanensis]
MCSLSRLREGLGRGREHRRSTTLPHNDGLPSPPPLSRKRERGANQRERKRPRYSHTEQEFSRTTTKSGDHPCNPGPNSTHR